MKILFESYIFDCGSREGAEFSNTSHINKFLEGDCLDLMQALAKESIDFIYMDPPFGTQKQQTLSNREGNLTLTYPDSWVSNASYIEWLAERLQERKRILNPLAQ